MTIFYDSEPNAQTISGLTISENTPVTVQISGVYYYDTGSTFNVEIADMDWLNSDTYPSILAQIVGTEYGLPTLSLGGGDLNNWTVDYDASNCTYSKSDWAITAANYCNISNTANITATVQDWTSGASANSANASICVNTYGNNDTRIYHDFRTENGRLTSAWGAWISTQDLTAYDDSLGLQVRCSRLIYPTINYTTYNPTAGQPDYSACAGTRTFFWQVYHTGISHSNLRFVFGDHNITEADITSDDFMMEISLDDVSWYNCNELYIGGALGDGDGCRIDTGSYTLDSNNRWALTLGTGGFTAAGTGPSGWGLFLRISWKAAISAKYLGSISEETWV